MYLIISAKNCYYLKYRSQAESSCFILNKSGSVKLAEVANNLFTLLFLRIFFSIFKIYLFGIVLNSDLAADTDSSSRIVPVYISSSSASSKIVPSGPTIIE
jgi:hypothetical protein